MPDLTLAQAMEWFGTDDAELNRRANAVRRYEADEQAGRVLAAEIRRRDAETCSSCGEWYKRSNLRGLCLTFGHDTSEDHGCRAWQKREGE